jgi:hypothetical protein
MRQENQQRDKVRATVEISSAGSGQTGLSPTVIIKRVSDGQYYDAVGGSFAVGVVTNSMLEYDSVNVPGVYILSIPSSQLDMELGSQGYIYAVTEITNSVYETSFISVEDEASELALNFASLEAVRLCSYQYAQLGTIVRVNLAMKTSPPTYGLAGAFVAKSIELRMISSDSYNDILVDMATDPAKHFSEIAKPNGLTAATTTAPIYSAGGGPSGENIYIIEVDDTSPFSVGSYVRGASKELGEDMVHEVLAIPSGTIMHVHSSQDYFYIINGDTVQGVVPTGVYSGFISFSADSYFSASDVSGELLTSFESISTGNSPKMTSTQDASWSTSIDLDIAGRLFRAG